MLLKPFDLSSYAQIDIPGTPNGAALAQLKSLLSALLDCCPGAVINHRPLAAALVSLAQKDRSLVPQSISTEDWANTVAQKVRVALAHVRRLRQQSALLLRIARSLTAAQSKSVSDLVAQYQPQAGMPAEDQQADGQQQADEEDPPPEPESAETARGLPDFTTFLAISLAQQRKRKGGAEAAEAAASTQDLEDTAAPLSSRQRVALSPRKVGLLMDCLALAVPRPANTGGQRQAIREARGASAEEAGSKTRQNKKNARQKQNGSSAGPSVMKRPAAAQGKAETAPKAETQAGAGQAGQAPAPSGFCYNVTGPYQVPRHRTSPRSTRRCSTRTRMPGASGRRRAPRSCRCVAETSPRLRQRTLQMTAS